MLRNIPSAFVPGAFAICVLAVAPLGSAIAQTFPTSEAVCQEQQQSCKGQVQDQLGTCLQNCASISGPNDCEQANQQKASEDNYQCDAQYFDCTVGWEPRGSYRITCVNASVSDGTLTAACKVGNSGRQNPGTYMTTSLPNAYACVDVANNNGVLQCAPAQCR
jgi:hypothetical protein